MRTSRVGTCSDAGFTLLELILVLLIIGTMAVLILPRVSLLTGDDLKRSARQLSSTIQFVSERSASSKRLLRLNFDLEKGRYWLSEPNDQGEFAPSNIDGHREWQLPEGVRFKDIVVARGKVAEGEVFTQFYASGRIDSTVLHLTNERERAVTLMVNPVTGRVRFYDDYRENVLGPAHAL